MRSCAFVVASFVTLAGFAGAGPVRVRHPEGLVHGFLTLKNEQGALLATGDLIQTAAADRVTSRLVFAFRDGSRYDETTVYSQRGAFKLIRDHLVEQGPAFPYAIDMSVDGGTGTVRVRYDDHGQSKIDTAHIDTVPELANGLVLTILKNVGSTPPEDLALVVATPKPRVVTLHITTAGEDPFETAGSRRRAIHFVVKAELGGVTGALAKLLGKAPPDSHVWILGGDAPAFVKAEQPFYAGGPLWTIELTGPTWRTSAARQPESWLPN